MSKSHSIFNNLSFSPPDKRQSIYPWAIIFVRWINFSYIECVHLNKHNTVKTHLLQVSETGETRKRLVYCKTSGVSTNETIDKVGFQSKQWISCRPKLRTFQYTSLDCKLNYSIGYIDKNKQLLALS